MGSLQCAMVGFAILKYSGASHFNPLENVVVQTVSPVHTARLNARLHARLHASVQSACVLSWTLPRTLRGTARTRRGGCPGHATQVGVATATMPLAGGFIGIIPALQLLDPPLRLSVGEQLAWCRVDRSVCAALHVQAHVAPRRGRGLIHGASRHAYPWLHGLRARRKWRLRPTPAPTPMHIHGPRCAALTYFGIFFAVPLRRQTVLVEQLPFPSGTATAKLIEMLHSGGGGGGVGGGAGGGGGSESRGGEGGEGGEGDEGGAPRGGTLQARWRALGASFGLSFGVALLGFFVPPLANLKVFT